MTSDTLRRSACKRPSPTKSASSCLRILSRVAPTTELTIGRSSARLEPLRGASCRFLLQGVIRVAPLCVQPQVDGQVPRPEDFVLARMVALVHQQLRRYLDGADDDPAKCDDAETAPRQEQVRQPPVGLRHQQPIPRCWYRPR